MATIGKVNSDVQVTPNWNTSIPTHEWVRHVDYPSVGWLKPKRRVGWTFRRSD